MTPNKKETNKTGISKKVDSGNKCKVDEENKYIKDLENLEEMEKLIETNKLVMLKFTAGWCAPCQIQAQYLEMHFKELLEVFPTLKAVSIDIDKFPKTAESFSIEYVPTLYIVYLGRLIKFQSGVRKVNEIINSTKEGIQKIDELYKDGKIVETIFGKCKINDKGELVDIEEEKTKEEVKKE